MDNANANDVFGIISYIEKYGNNIIDIIVIDEEPWFKGNDISRILAYSNYSKAVRENVDFEDRMSLRELLTNSRSPLLRHKYDLNQLKTTYINESGLFELIFGSRLESAKKFKRWISKEVLPKICKLIGRNYLSELTESKRLLLEMDQDLEALRAENLILKKNKKDLSKYLRNMEPVVKNQIFYLATSTAYAHQNIFEFGGCKSLKDVAGRLSNYNTGRAEGDLMYFCKIYHCTDYRIIDEIVHRILAKFKDKEGSRKEMIRLRYNRLVEIIDAITENYDRHVDYLNEHCHAFLEESVYLDPIVPEPLEPKVSKSRSRAPKRSI